MKVDDFLDSVKMTLNQRGQEYGAVEQSFNAIAKRWSMVLGVDVDVTQVARCMIELKLVRLSNCQGHEDSLRDIVGYTALLTQLYAPDA